METYFTFADGSLRYDCPSCRQRCCRGKGFALGGEQLVPLVAKLPTLAPLLKLRGGAWSATNLADGCWFLDDAGWCSIETTHGRALKPSTCRLFPFNRVYRVGDVRVVDVNTVLCPVEAAGGGGVTHAELVREIDELAGSPLIDAATPLPPALDVNWLDVERKASHAAVVHAEDADALAAALGEDDGARLSRAWCVALGGDVNDLSDLERAVAKRAALLVPSLRWNFIFRKDAAPWATSTARLPRRLRALVTLGALASRIRGQAPSLRGLTELWQNQARALDVMARWDETVKLAAPRFDGDAPAHLLPALGALLGAAFRGGRTLGQLVEVAGAALPAEQRTLALSLVAAQLDTLLPGA